jgi:ABC-type uncharacterized transport system permease subunit
MTSTAPDPAGSGAVALRVTRSSGARLRLTRSPRHARLLEVVALRALAVVVAMALFAAFVAAAGVDAIDVFRQIARGAFGSAFSVQNTLQRAAPLMLAALATALPARLGLIIIGGEGAVVVGGLAAAVTAGWVSGAPPTAVLTAMFFAGLVAGGLWIALAGALRAFRGVNETIGSLLLSYIAIALLNHLVEGPLRDPASLNKPSTLHIGEANMLHQMGGVDVHWGFAYGVVACVLGYALMHQSVFGFSAAIVGGNVRAAMLNGLPVRRMMVIACFLGGGAAGLAGMAEVAAIHGRANASLVAGYGYTGVLVSFIARHNPLGVIPVAIVLGGIGASSGLLQRVHGLPDATVNVLQGFLFLSILATDTLHGKLGIFRAAAAPAEAAPQGPLEEPAAGPVTT